MSTRTSFLDIREGAISLGPVQMEPFRPDSVNLFPKMPSRISENSWELWEFEAFGDRGAPAILVSLYRDARGVDQGGFHAEVHAVWPDARKWGKTLYFQQSTITAEADASGRDEGTVTGTWVSADASGLDESEKSITFTIDPDLSSTKFRFNVPGEVVGEMELRSTAGSTGAARKEANLPATEDAAQLCPSVYYTFPMGRLTATANILFTCVEGDGDRKLSIGLDEDSDSHGSMVRGWSTLAWPRFMNDAYYTVGHVGPYKLQLLRTLGSAAVSHFPYAVARLHREDQLVCAAHHAIGDGSEQMAKGQDVVRVDKIFDTPGSAQPSGISSNFRDTNVGYIIEFASPRQQQRWRFETRHRLPWWSEPTSEPGPDGCGKSGWVETFFGGLVDEGEAFEGAGIGGQLQIPVP
ncbi:hypothetical protein G3M48_000681 [Beauveria asiatica]|uniref:Uncharacterized protein n=1 Tax=Beauveria asiatica TaxID=1069075 RepID=A0AAW0S0A3_9HYPO